MAWHNLRANASTAQPTQMIVFDTETTPAAAPGKAGTYSHHFRLGHAVAWRWDYGKATRRKELAFSDTKVFWEWVSGILSPQRTTWVWSHNLGFDLTVARFWERMESREYTREEPAARRRRRVRKPGKHRKLDGFCCTEDPPTILKLWHSSFSRVTFLDTLNFWKASLAKLGSAIGLPKMPLPDWSESDEAWAQYCANDARILEGAVLALLRFVLQLDLGKLRYTAPAQAFSAFRHRFLPDKPIVFHSDKAARRLERESYFNGRCEAYFRGRVRVEGAEDWWAVRERDKRLPLLDGPVHHLDVSAMYPAIMAGNRFPRKLIGHMEGRPNMLALLPVPAEQCIARVTLETARPFPVRTVARGTIYPIGRYQATLCGPELAQAVQVGAVKEWLEVCCYELDDLFTAWVQEFWRRRIDYEKQGLTAYADLCKLLMNSLYGKFAQKTPQWEERPDLDFDEPWGSFVYTTYPDQSTYQALVDARLEVDPAFVIGEPLAVSYRCLAGQVQEMRRRTDSDDSFTAVASFVTSYGRVFMDNLRRTAGYSQVYYQGVDSLHVSDTGLKRLQRAGMMRQRELGFLRVLDTYTNCRYWGPMDYQADGRIVRAGQKDRAQLQSDGTWQQQSFQGINSVVQKRPAGTIQESPQKLTHRPIKPDVDVDRDGWLNPIRLPD